MKRERTITTPKPIRPRLLCILEGYLEPDRHLPIAVPKQMLRYTNVRLMQNRKYETFPEAVASIMYDYLFLNTLQPFLFVFNPFYPLYTREFYEAYAVYSRQVEYRQPIESIRRNLMRLLLFRNVVLIAILNPAEEYTDGIHKYLQTVYNEFALPHLESVLRTEEAISTGIQALREVFLRHREDIVRSKNR